MNRVKIIEKRKFQQAHLIAADVWQDNGREAVDWIAESAMDYVQDRYPEARLVERSITVEMFEPGEYDHEEFGLQNNLYALVLTTAEVLV
jgi:hypothetical protein